MLDVLREDPRSGHALWLAQSLCSGRTAMRMCSAAAPGQDLGGARIRVLPQSSPDEELGDFVIADMEIDGEVGPGALAARGPSR